MVEVAVEMLPTLRFSSQTQLRSSRLCQGKSMTAKVLKYVLSTVRLGEAKIRPQHQQKEQRLMQQNAPGAKGVIPLKLLKSS